MGVILKHLSLTYMKLSDEQLSVALLARSLALAEVEAGRMDRLNLTVKAFYKSGLNVLLLFMSESEFNEAIK